MCVYVCMLVWCSGCVLSILFSICLPPAPPVHPSVIGYLTFAICWGANSRPFLMKQQWSRWDFGCAHHIKTDVLIIRETHTHAGAANAMERGCKALTLDPTTRGVARFRFYKSKGTEHF